MKNIFKHLFIIILVFVIVGVGYADDRDTVVYVTRTGERYHTGSCSYLRQSRIQTQLGDAVSQGYTPCSRCRPPVLNSLPAQNTFFYSRSLNGLSIPEKINTYFGFIGRPVPSNYELSNNGLYVQRRELPHMTPEEFIADIQAGEVDFRLRNGVIGAVRILKTFRDSDEYTAWWYAYYLVIANGGEYQMLDDFVFRKGNQIVIFDIFDDEGEPRSISIAGELYYFGYINFGYAN